MDHYAKAHHISSSASRPSSTDLFHPYRDDFSTHSSSLLDAVDSPQYQQPHSHSSTAAHPNDVSFHRRARELYQYFHPLSFERSGDSGEDNLLATQAQLVAFRFRAKCMINFLDNARQYVVAEAEDPALHKPPVAPNKPPSVWFECRGVGTRYQSVCNYTIAVDESANDHLPFFEVTDLAADSRFANIPIVAGDPYLRYYAGTPLYTRSGIAIGAVVIVDKSTRLPMPRKDQEFLRFISKNIVKILELQKHDRQQRKTSHMNSCLSRFVDPLHRSISSSSFLSAPSIRSNSRPSSIYSSRVLTPDTSGQNQSSKDHSTEQAQHLKERSRERPQQDTNKTRKVSSDESLLDMNDDGLGESDTSGLAPFPRAAELLREALGTDTCGVVFLDTVAISSPPIDSQPTTSESFYDVSRSRFQSHGTSPVLASSFNHTQSWPHAQTKARRRLSSPLSFVSLCTESLIALAERYPSGQLWTFDAEGEVCLDALEDTKVAGICDKPQWREDGALLLQHFPQASCIYMKSIWNARSHRMVVAMAYSGSQYQSFTSEHDVPFISAFCNCITVDLVRLAALAANRQKGDFIGSISHELRSPLHGILASCDLLEDTPLSPSQQSLVETANSCGRTLLDTISMVLDWSKVNAFERDWRKVNSNKASFFTTVAIKADSTGQSLLLPNLYGNVDLASIVEEVVEGAVVGQGFQNIQDVDFADLGAQARGRFTKGAPSKTVTKPPIEVFVDIQKAPKDWVYVTQPGAFRRCLMNMVGNSLKYTISGWVKVALQVTQSSTTESPSESVRDIVTLTVEDTGKGISSEYLQTKLFSPFAQENVLAPGTGLGLSLTKSIIDMLEGEIHIESAVGQGTKVTITIPMLPRNAAFQQALTASTNNTPSTAGTRSSSSDENVRLIQEISQGRKLACFHADAGSDCDTERIQMMRACLDTYIRDWFAIEILDDWMSPNVDLLLVNDYDVPILVERIESLSKSYPSNILVFCTKASQFSGPKLSRQDGTCVFHAISKPFGPHRLAKCLQACFQTTQSPSENSQSSIGTVAAGIPCQPDISPTICHDPVNPSRPDVTFNENSLNATLALTTPPSTSSTLQPLSTSPATSMEEFPFPGQDSSSFKPSDSQEPAETAQKVPQELPARARSAPAAASERKASEGPIPGRKRRKPRLLLVDDNNINLKLLSTNMKKLKYTDVTLATDGRQAADLFKTALDSSLPPDVIFMDLSMPILDGFDSTREIRALEKAYLDVLPKLVTPSPALIIALSGLASESDQKRAFEAGVDLFMTKPASFKEVGILLQTWEANGGVEGGDRGPHGAVTGDLTVKEGDVYQ